MSPGIGNNLSAISVSSPPGGANRFAGAGGAQAGLNATKIGNDIARVTLTPLKAWGAAANVQFILSVAGTNTVRVVTPMVGQTTIPAAWFDNGNPPKAINKPIKLPGFTGVVNDAEYEQFDDDGPLSVEDLQILPNVTEQDFDSLNLDAVLAEGLDPSLLSFSPSLKTWSIFPIRIRATCSAAWADP